MAIDLNHLRIGDTIVFADGTQGICTVSYNNGGARFIRWAVPGKDWSESDSYCCLTMFPVNGKLGYESTDGTYSQAPKDIVDIIKPPLHELQDKISELTHQLSTRDSDNA